MAERPAKRAKAAAAETVVSDQRLAGKDVGTKTARMTLTVQEIAGDRLTKLAQRHWSTAARARPNPPPFRPDLVARIYQRELGGSRPQPPQPKRIMLLEVSQYLENYLVPFFDQGAARLEHVLSMVLMLNEKIREGVAPWGAFNRRPEVFSGFMSRVLSLRALDQLARLYQHERTALLVFTIHAFSSLEEEMVRGVMLRLVSLPLWHALSPGRLQLELHAQPALAKKWKALLKKEAKAAKAAAAGSEGGAAQQQQRAEAMFVPALLDELLETLGRVEGLLTGGAAAAAAAAAAEAAVSEEEEEEGEEGGDGGGKGEDADAEAEAEAGLEALLDEEDQQQQEKQQEGAEAATGGASAAAGKASGKKQQGGKGKGAAAAAAAVPEKGVAVEQGRGVLRRAILHCERSVELLVDLLSQLPTRRFVHAVLDDRAVLVKARRSALYRAEQHGALFRQLLDLVAFYLDFPIDDHTGEALEEDDVIGRHYEKVCQLQRLLFRYWPQLHPLALTTCGNAEKRSTLLKSLSSLSDDQLRHLVTRQLRLLGEEDPTAADRAGLLEVFVNVYERRRSQREAINALPLYPNEAMLWDQAQIPSQHYTGERPLALMKLNLQFLTPTDYLLRNFHLFRLEAAYEVREDLVDALRRLSPCRDPDQDGALTFRGWAKMAQPLVSLRITQVAPPKVGALVPASVLAEVVIDTKGLRGDVRSGWDELKQHDVVFLLAVDPPEEADAAELAAAAGAGPPANGRGRGRRQRGDWDEGVGVVRAAGLRAVRGAEIIEVRDENGDLMNDFTGRVRPDERKPAVGFKRTYLVELDAAQYQLDLNAAAAAGPGATDVYSTFSLLLRREAKENNFKAVLESIRDTLNEAIIIPDWLRDIFLGYGDPAAAHYSAMQERLGTVDFKDTFLDGSHVEEAFPQYQVVWEGGASPAAPPPYRITFPPPEQDVPAPGSTRSGITSTAAAAVDPSTSTPAAAAAAGEAQGQAAAGSESSRPVLRVTPYTPLNMGPYPADQPRRNTVRFTPVQVEAIRSGVQPGLTMVVGPPGTGKTDTAVQILSTLYHNCPGQRTLLITHSNQALNDLFAKLAERDVPSRYLLRLGMGERDLDTEDNYSRQGRLNASLARRLTLLAEVEKMARQFNVSEDVAYTCETAGYFWLLHVLSRWERFTAAVAGQAGKPEAVGGLFPFKDYFADAPQPLFKGQGYEEDLEVARGCFRHLQSLFTELEELRPFELLKGSADRINYLCTCQAKVVAMTCTHAALKRRDFLKLGFKYDNLVMEEAAQVLEVETFIPMVLQRHEDGVSRLKRVILIGDHHQLPPVVQHMAFQKYAHLDQSLFTRFIRLGTPYVELDAQGRARASIAQLYSWRYRSLGNLPAVLQEPSFLGANAGFGLEYQFVDVADYQGRGESEPLPHYYQNLGEAEYVVAMYMFMRLMGYPAAKISILTTYNGQKDLIRDVVEQRCAMQPLFGRPSKVTTVDKYQGQQNDYVLLSLVRTRHVGHLRDVRRLVVAMSRARLGLYLFGRAELFSNCYELQPTFKQLLARPTQLALVKGESYGSCSRQLTDKVALTTVKDVMEMMHLVGLVTQEQMAKQQQQRAAAAAPQLPPPRPPPGSPPPAAAPAAAAAGQAGKGPAGADGAAAAAAAAAAGAAAGAGGGGDGGVLPPRPPPGEPPTPKDQQQQQKQAGDKQQQKKQEPKPQ